MKHLDFLFLDKLLRIVTYLKLCYLGVCVLAMNVKMDFRGDAR